jgi:hypothetical protein
MINNSQQTIRLEYSGNPIVVKVKVGCNQISIRFDVEGKENVANCPEPREVRICINVQTRQTNIRRWNRRERCAVLVVELGRRRAAAGPPECYKRPEKENGRKTNKAKSLDLHKPILSTNSCADI